MGTDIRLDIEDALELVLYRALRGEVPPSVRAITADLSTRPIHLQVFGYDDLLDKQLFEEVIESEMGQALLAEVPRSLARLNGSFHEADEFNANPGRRVIYPNDYAKA